MLLKNIPILFIVLFFSFFKPFETKQTINSNQNSSSKISIDSLSSGIISASYFYLINSKSNLKEDRQKISGLKDEFKRSFLQSLILKRQQKYDEMFNALFSVYSKQQNYLPYFDELVFSATATGKLPLLEDSVDFLDGNIKNKNYLKGLIRSAKGENQKALDNFKKALQEDSTNKDILYQLSYAYRNTGDYDNAEKILKKASRLFRDDTWYNTKALLAEGSLYFLSGDYSNASKIYKKGLELSKSNSDLQNEAKACINLGIIEDIYGNYEKSHEYFSRAISISFSIDDFENLAIAYSELGVSYTFINNLIEAKKNYIKSQEIFEKIRNRHRLSLLLNNLGKIFMSLFDYKSALEYFEKGILYAGDNKRAKVLGLTGIADVYANLSNYTKALQYYKEAQQLSSEIKEISLSTNIDYGLGALNFNLNRYGSAIKYFSSASKFAEESGDPYSQTDLNHKIALSWYELDSVNLAENYFKKALELSRENSLSYYESLVLTDFAFLLKDKKDYKKALKYLERGEKIARESGFEYLLARGKVVAGEIASEQNEFKDAEELFKKAVEISKRLNEFNLLTESYYLLAKMYDEKGFNEAAESYYKSATNLIEDVSRPLFEKNDIQISYFSSKREVYNSFAEYYLNQNKFKEAFELIDKSRSRNTVQNLNNIKLYGLIKEQSKLDKIYEYEWILHSGIYDDAETDSVKRKYRELKETLTSEQPALKRYLNFDSFVTLTVLQESLKDNENFLSFYSTENNTHIFLITNNEFRHFEINAGKKEIADFLKNISPYFTTDDSFASTYYNQDLFSFNAEASYNFYETFLKKALSEIPEGVKIIVSPSSELITLPFDLLVSSYNNEESAYDYTNKDYLINHYNFSYIPSAAVLLHQKKNDSYNSNKILLIGNPVIDNNEKVFAERRELLEESTGLPRNIALFPLKYSEEEIESISKLINADKILIGSEATETGFKENSELAKVIHLSTHSYLFNKQPVVFFSNSNDKKNDGYLEAGEIVQLKLNSDLVVLSSCKSGLGTVDASEGIIGMTKAFFEAGVKSVVVSLWEVNDKYTSKFMTLFYDKLSEGYDKDEAMRLAKIDFIKNYSPNPYFWSAFILAGNTDKIEIRKAVDINPFVAGISLIMVFALLLLVLKRKSLVRNHM
jgi:CHAT domain-containing protein/Tfp pilus assembly protein PilF